MYSKRKMISWINVNYISIYSRVPLATGFTLFYHCIVHIWDLSSAPSNDHCQYPSQIQKGSETFIIIISLF